MSPSHAFYDEQSIVAKSQSRSTWLSGFEGEPTVFHQPTLQWVVDKIDLGGPTCGSGDKVKSCIVWTAIVGAGYTAVESSPLSDNAFGQVQVNAVWPLIPGTLNWRSTGRLTGRDYHKAPNGREDIQFDGSSQIEWTPAKNLFLSAGGAYTHNGSTFDPVEYTNAQFQPQVKLTWIFE